MSHLYLCTRNATFTFWAKIECPGSFPPTMPCTSGVRFMRKCWAVPLTVWGVSKVGEGGRQADGDREYRGTTQESGAAPSGTLTPDNMGGPGWAGHSSALYGQSAGCNAASYRWDTTATNKHQKVFYFIWRPIKSISKLKYNHKRSWFTINNWIAVLTVHDLYLLIYYYS